MLPDKTREELLAALIAQKLTRGGYSIEKAVWLSALEVGIKLPLPSTTSTLPKEEK